MINRQTVLLGDDDGDEAFLVQYAVQRAGLPHRLIHLYDGETVIEYLKGAPPYDNRLQHPLPGLLLLDLKMPRINGFGVLSWLAGRPDLNWLPTVVLSSSAFESDAQMAAKLGAREFLTKPADIDDLVRMMQGLHQRWLSDQPVLTAPVVAVEPPACVQRPGEV